MSYPVDYLLFGVLGCSVPGKVRASHNLGIDASLFVYERSDDLQGHISCWPFSRTCRI